MTAEREIVARALERLDAELERWVEMGDTRSIASDTDLTAGDLRLFRSVLGIQKPPVGKSQRKEAAKALARNHGDTEDAWGLYLTDADSVLTALGLADGSHVIVPVEPTKAMLHAATLIAPTWDDEVSLRKYRAMLTSAKESDRG